MERKSIQQRIADGEFDVPWLAPDRPDFNAIDSKSEEQKARQNYEAANRAAYDEHNKKSGEARRRFFVALAEDCGVVGNLKLPILERIAWDMGHSGGYYEVANHYIELVDLIDPRVKS